MSKSLTNISNYLFACAAGINKIERSDDPNAHPLGSIASLGAYAFGNCSFMAFTISESLQVPGRIGKAAFNGCIVENLPSYTITYSNLQK